jgi:hypothetical protein
MRLMQNKGRAAVEELAWRCDRAFGAQSALLSRTLGVAQSVAQGSKRGLARRRLCAVSAQSKDPAGPLRSPSFWAEHELHGLLPPTLQLQRRCLKLDR